jgi:hypothetical protein
MLTNHACDSTSFYSISSRLTHAACKSISFGKNQSDHLFWGFNEDPSRRMPEEIRSMWLTPKRNSFETLVSLIHFRIVQFHFWCMHHGKLKVTHDEVGCYIISLSVCCRRYQLAAMI